MLELKQMSHHSKITNQQRTIDKNRTQQLKTNKENKLKKQIQILKVIEPEARERTSTSLKQNLKTVYKSKQNSTIDNILNHSSVR